MQEHSRKTAHYDRSWLHSEVGETLRLAIRDSWLAATASPRRMLDYLNSTDCAQCRQNSDWDDYLCDECQKGIW
jgi:hypothetical protein